MPDIRSSKARQIDSNTSAMIKDDFLYQ